jgi:hypothetical protein
MKNIILILFFFSQLNVFAQGSVSNLNHETTTANDIIAPALIPTNNPNEVLSGAFAVEPSNMDPETINRHRTEMLQMEKGVSHSDVFMQTTMRFAPETFTFFVAVGAVTFNSMWIKSHGDPLAMERHIMSLKDPIAHISFYSFMQAQGFFMNFHTGKASFAAMDQATRARTMRRLSYQGMAVGSFASSVVADLGSSVTQCVDKWFKGKKDNDSLQSCNMAWKQWTVRKKFTQYFPQIISMWASQAVTDMLEAKALSAFERTSAKAFAEKYLSKRALTGLVYKIRAADVVIVCIPYGGWVSRGVKFLGAVTRIAAFVAVDQVVSKYINRPLNNMIKPTLFDIDVFKMNKYWSAADAANWDERKITDKEQTKKFVEEIEAYTEEMQSWRGHLNESVETDLAGWQEMTRKLLSQIDFSYKFYHEFSSLIFETLNRKHQIAIGSLEPSAMKTISGYPFNRDLPFYGVKPGMYKAAGGGSLNDYYLLNPSELEKRQKEHVLNTAKVYLVKSAQMKINKTEKMILARFLNNLNSGLDHKMVEGITEMNRVRGDIVAYEIALANRQPGDHFVGYGAASYSSLFVETIKEISQQIGTSAQPILSPLASYSQAIAAHSSFKATSEQADYSQWSLKKNYGFNKATDLMIYKMICSKAQGEFREFKAAGISWLHPEFSPPSLIKIDSSRDQFCETRTDSQNLYYSKIGGTNLTNYFLTHLNYNAIGDYRKENNAGVFEKWWVNNTTRTTNAKFDEYDKKFKKIYDEAYDNYIGDHSLYTKISDLFNKSPEYLPNNIIETLQTETSTYLQLINRALIVNSMKLQKEKELTKKQKYDDLWSAMGQQILNPFSELLDVAVESKDGLNYLKRTSKNAHTTAFTTMYDRYAPEVAQLHTLINSYYYFVKTNKPLRHFTEMPLNRIDNTYVAKRRIEPTLLKKKVSLEEMKALSKELKQMNQQSDLEDAKAFEAYIEHAKKVDEAINNILVRAGLMKVVAKKQDQFSDDLSTLFSETGSENTQKQYEKVAVKNPTLRQQVVLAAVKGIRQVESEVRRMIRMRVALKNSLVAEQKEFGQQ